MSCNSIHFWPNAINLGVWGRAPVNKHSHLVRLFLVPVQKRSKHSTRYPQIWRKNLIVCLIPCRTICLPPDKRHELVDHYNAEDGTGDICGQRRPAIAGNGRTFGYEFAAGIPTGRMLSNDSIASQILTHTNRITVLLSWSGRTTGSNC